MQESPPQGGFASDLGSELGSVEDAAGYELRQQLRAAAAASLAVAAELRACQAERDRVQAERDRVQAERDQALVERDQAVAAAAELRAAGQRGEAQSLRNAEALKTARLRIRATAAAERRHVLSSQRPARGEFDLPSDYAVPSSISQRGAHDTQVMSTDSISKEGRQRPAKDLLRERVRKKSRLLGAASTTLRYETTKRRTNHQGDSIGGVGFSTRNQVEAFRRFSAPGFKSHTTVGSAPAIVAMGADAVTVKFRGFGRNKTRRSVDLSNPTPINAVGANSPQTVNRDILAVQLAVAKKIVEDRMIEKADLVHLQVDSSTFGRYNMQAVLLTLMYIIWDELDALGTPMYHVIMKSCCLDSLPCADKQAKDVVRQGVLVDYRKEAAFNFGMQLLMAGIAAAILIHDCVVLGLDRGPEAVGAGKGRKWAARRDAFCGRGGYLEQVWGTREALEQPIASEEYGLMLVTLMAFLGVSQKDQEFKTRPAPIPMDTEAPVLRVPMDFVKLTRVVDPVDRRKKIVIAKEASVLNEANPEVSTRAHPLRKYPLYAGGSADVEWCDKHALSCAVKMTTNKMKAFFREVMRMIRLIRNQHIWIALSTQASAVLEAKGCRELDDTDLALRDAIGPVRLEASKRSNPAGLQLPVEACVTRWGLLYAGAAQMCANLLLFSSLFPLALADGTQANKILAMQAVCSMGGFVDQSRIQYTNPRVGRAVHYMMQPDHILRQHIVRFINIFVWHPLLAACAHNKECAMTKLRGLGSLVLVVLWVLKRGIWTAGGRSSLGCKPWKMHLQLGHRGPSQVKLAKISCLFLSARLENEWAWREKPKDFESNGPAAQKMSPLKHLYGEFYTPAMEHGISDLQKAIVDACRMDLAAKSNESLMMLPADLRSSFCGWKSAGGRQKSAGGEQKKSTYFFRIQQAMWLLHRDTCAAAVALTTKYRLTICDPQGYLAGMTGVEAHRILRGQFEYEGAGTVGTFYTANVLARANAAVLWLQAHELMARDPNVADHLQAPLKHLYTREALIELREFSLGAPVKEDLYQRGTLMSDEDGVQPDISTLFYPVMKFKTIAGLSVLAAARPTSNNAVESRWSILTGKYMSGMRNAKGQCLSQNAKQPDYHTFKMKEWMILPSFLAIVRVAYCFLLEHFVSIASLFEARHDASQQKMKELREDSAQETYADTNIRATKKNAKNESKDNAQPARAERRAQPRNKSNQLSASSGSESDDSENSWSADNSDSDEGIPQATLDSEDDEDTEILPPPVAAEQGAARKTQLNQQPVQEPTSRITRSQSQTIPNSADAADGSLPALSRVPCSSISSSSSANSEANPALAAAAQGHGEKSQSQQQSLKIPSSSRSSEQLKSSSTDGPCVATSSRAIVDDSSAACIDAPGRASVDQPHQEPMSEDEVCDWTIHPVELKSELEDTTAQKLGPYRLNYTRWMLKSRKWQKTDVVFTQRSRGDVILFAHLTRCDGVRFDLVARTPAFYVLHTPMGLELISVQSMDQSVPNRLCLVVTFNRVLGTKRAAQAAESRHDLVSTLTCKGDGGRSIVSTRLGSDNLTRLLIAQQKGATVVHEGDIAYTDFAHNIVGVVGSLTPHATEQDDKRKLLGHLRQNQSISAKQAKDISCFDVVIQGPHFSDTAPPQS